MGALESQLFRSSGRPLRVYHWIFEKIQRAKVSLEAWYIWLSSFIHMAKQNTSQMVATYTTDFNTQVTNLPVRWSSEAPVPTGIYVPRTGICAAGRIGFTPRYLLATFNNGVHKYVVPSLGSVTTLKTALETAGAQCLDLIGESWGRLTTTVMNDPAPAFKAAPYLDSEITGFGDRETGQFDYTSDVLGTVKAGYNVEAAPAALLTAGKAGLVNAAAGTGVQNRDVLNIEPRHFVIHADVDDDTTVARRANASVVANLATYIDSMASAGYYLSYQGESAYAIHLL